jgi:S-adenosyl methyltransferase
VQQTFDLSRPIAVSLLAILQFVLDDDEAQRIIKHLMDPLVPGSVLALSTVTTDSSPAEASRGVSSYNSSGVPARSRTKAEVEALFEGLDLLDPGVVLVHRWRPDEQDRAIRDDQVFMYGAIAVKP